MVMAPYIQTHEDLCALNWTEPNPLAEHKVLYDEWDLK